MDGNTVSLFPAAADIVWSVVNLLLLAAIVGGIICGVRYFGRLRSREK